jgi:hypothetical protein
MATRLGLVEREPGRLRTTELGEEVAQRGQGTDLPLLFQLLWSVFPYFREVVIAICESPSGFLLPVARYEGRFDDAAREQGVRVDQMSF